MQSTPPPQIAEGEEVAERPVSHTLASATTVDAKEEMATEIGRAIARALQAQPKGRPDLPRATCLIFAGAEYENPAEFLQKLREYAEFYEIQDDEEILHLASKQLRGEAQWWFAPFGPYIKTYLEFETRLLNKYDDISTRARLQAKLYSEPQKDHENVSLFILKKRALYHRLFPRTEEHTIIPVIIELLRTDIRAYLRTRRYYSLDEMDAAATQIEEDLHVMSQNSRRSQASQFTNMPRVNVQAPRPPYPPRTQSTNHPPPRTGPATTGLRNVNPPPRPLNANLPSSPCRYCAEWHFHARCPQNPYRMSPGNPPRADGQGPNISNAPPAQ